MLTALLLAACSGAPDPGGGAGAPPAPDPHAAGADCAGCHSAEAAAWGGSFHDRALQPAAAALGRFDGQPVALAGLTATPTAGPEGPAFVVSDDAGERRWAVAYAFGAWPLQQYLVQGEGGRLLVAPIAWDVDGARWYDPAPDGASGDPDDPLYWAGLLSTWNHMCADCHSTEVDKGYDLASGSYHTTFQAEDVSCLACHGEGPDFNDLSTAAAQVETCGPCHARRQRIAPPDLPGRSWLDHYYPALLDAPSYQADGGTVPVEESFVLGSFLQSRMYAAGVRCTDCHDPHSTAAVASGDALCQRCHAGPQYGSEHHGHEPGGPGSACVDCHMPAALFMGLDARRDHYLRPPDPHTAREVGAGDACSGCHTEGEAWLAAAPAEGARAGYTRAAAAARDGDPAGAAVLLASAKDPEEPAFRRASALALLRPLPPSEPSAPSAVAALLRDGEALVRAEAARTAAAWGRAEALWPLLLDPVRAVRFAALRGLLDAAGPPPDRAAAASLMAVIEEYQRAATADGDLPSSHANMGAIYLALGDARRAEASLREALEIEPAFTPARENLAALLLQLGDREGAEAVLRAAPSAGR